MSSTAEETELKAGHPPAVKVGGMRVARTHKSSASDKEKEEMSKEDKEEFGDGIVKIQHDAVISGTVIKESKAFPPEAVKHFHEQPLPSKENRPCQMKHNINQPK